MTHPHTADSRQPSGPPLVLIGLALLASRLVILPFPQPASDVVDIYPRYAREQEEAARRGLSFYEFHAREVRRQEEDARAAGTLVAPIDEYRDVEYPPLALAAMRLPTLWMGKGPPGTFEARYYFAFRAGMAVVDVGLVVLLVGLLRGLFPGETAGEKRQRLLVYAVSTAALWPLLYDRLDLLLAALTVLALALLVGRLRYGWSFALLAVAVHFKLVPVVLAPLWVVGSMPAGRPLDFWRPRVLGGLAARAGMLLALIGGGFGAFYLCAGERSLAFLAYHRARPVEIGSLYACLPLLLRPLGHPVTVSYSYGSINVDSPLTPALVALSPWLTAGALLAGTALVLAHFRRVSAAPAAEAVPGAALAQHHSLLIVRYALLLLMLFIATNKVFSPQYLLWLAPLVALLPLDRRARRLFVASFLVVCILSTVLVPFLFLSDLIDPGAPRTLPRAIQQPTARVVALLVIRNGLFLSLVVGLALHLLRKARQGSGGQGTASERQAVP